jgi:hypothetical protein
MSPALLDTMAGILGFSLAFFSALVLPLALQLLLLYLVGWAFNSLIYAILPIVGSFLELIGTPIHEFSHAIGCLITFCGVQAIKPLSDRSGTAGVIPAHPNFLTSLAAGLAPLIGGTLVIWLTATYVIPGFQIPSLPPLQVSAEEASSAGATFRASMDYLSNFVKAPYRALPHLDWGNWRTYIGLYIALSTSLQLTLSKADRSFLLQGILYALVLGLLASTWLYLSREPAQRLISWQQTILPHLLAFSTAVSAAFFLTSLGVIVLFPLAFIRGVREGTIGIRRTR